MDVAIVGGGPAGAWCARELARRGARVTVFDPSHPREKPCGGGVTGRALALVASAIDVGGLATVAIDEARFRGTMDADAAPVSVRLPAHGASPASAMVVVSRAIFDRALLDAAIHAGAEHVAERVRDVRVDAHGAFLQAGSSWVRADVVVGADGANSLVRRRLSRAFHRSELSIAAGFFVRGATSTVIDIAFSARPAGYLWSFPRHDHLAVGACAQADACSADEMRTATLAWIRRAGHAGDARLERYSWPIPSPSLHPATAAPIAGPRWLLVGDAAGLVDPITREGIYFGLESGALAAEALSEAGDPCARYRTWLDAGIHPELVHAARLKAGFFRRPFLRLAIEGLARSERIREVMADLVAGRQPYLTLRRRLIATREIGLAWRLFTRMHTV